MKRDGYTAIICGGFCSFYKGSSEELTCGTYEFLTRNLTPAEITSHIHSIRNAPSYSCDGDIRLLACERCAFIQDGCDFRAGLGTTPCGGYTIMEWLLKG